MLTLKTIATRNPDAYLAGREIAEAVASIDPEVILFFASVNYAAAYTDFRAGILDGLNKPPTHVVGVTGDGFYSDQIAAEYGISAIAFQSGGTVQWRAALAGGANRDPAQAVQTLVQICGRNAPFAFVSAACDGGHNDGFSKAISDLTQSRIIGGFACDDRQFAKRYVFLDQVAMDDGAVMLTGEGPIRLLVNVGAGWSPRGEPQKITKTRGNCIVETIGNQTAKDFLEAQLGMLFAECDKGLYPAALFDDPTRRDVYHLRAIVHVYPDGAVEFFGDVHEGQSASACMASPEDVIHGIRDTIAAPLAQCPHPKAAIVCNCVGRKWFLGDRWLEEYAQIKQHLDGIPFVGVPTLGEIASFLKPDGTQTRTMLQNNACTIAFITDA